MLQTCQKEREIALWQIYKKDRESDVKPIKPKSAGNSNHSNFVSYSYIFLCFSFMRKWTFQMLKPPFINASSFMWLSWNFWESSKFYNGGKLSSDEEWSPLSSFARSSNTINCDESQRWQMSSLGICNSTCLRLHTMFDNSSKCRTFLSKWKWPVW